MTTTHLRVICSLMEICWLLAFTPGLTTGERNLARAYERMAEKYGVTIIVFNSLDIASAWFGVEASLVWKHRDDPMLFIKKVSHNTFQRHHAAPYHNEEGNIMSALTRWEPFTR